MSHRPFDTSSHLSSYRYVAAVTYERGMSGRRTIHEVEDEQMLRCCQSLEFCNGTHLPLSPPP